MTAKDAEKVSLVSGALFWPSLRPPFPPASLLSAPSQSADICFLFFPYQYPGQIVFNAEDDTHYRSSHVSQPTSRFPRAHLAIPSLFRFLAVLTVAQTLEFALKMKTPRIRPDGMSRKQFEAEYLVTLLKTFGIEHARDTMVGNENVRGVSGGERKRVSM